MRDTLGILFSAMCFLVGAVLIYQALSISDSSQSMNVIGGAILISLGLIILWHWAKEWFVWRRHYNQYKK